MNRDEMIEKAIHAHRDALYEGVAYPAWGELPECAQNSIRKRITAVLESVGALPPEESVGTRKRDPKTGDEAILTDDDDPTPWLAYKGQAGNWLTDADVADWEIIADVPKATIDAESLARWLWGGVGDEPAWVERTTNDIRAWVDEHGYRPPIPEGRVTIDLSESPIEQVRAFASTERSPSPIGRAYQAELARRGEQA